METRETSILFDQKRIEKAILRAAEIAKDINEMITDGSIFDLFINFLAQKIIQNEQSGQVALTNIGKILRRKNERLKTEALLKELEKEKNDFVDRLKEAYPDRAQYIYTIIGETRMAANEFYQCYKDKNEKRQFIDKWKPIFEERILILHARLHSGPQTPVE